MKPGTKIVDKKTKAAYKVMADNTVQYTKVTSKKAKTVKVPSTITVNGVKCQVTSIAPKAMKGNKKLTKVVIPASVRTIGAQAFAGCTNLTDIYIPDTVTSIADDAFLNCDNVTIHADEGSVAEKFAQKLAEQKSLAVSL